MACRCDSLVPGEDRVPAAMLALDLWLPPSYNVDTWNLVDAGQLGPAVRPGWFAPPGSAVPHWRLLTSPATTATYRPSSRAWDTVIAPNLLPLQTWSALPHC